MAALQSKTSKIFAWIIVFILIIGLAGFGIQDVIRSSGQNEVIKFADQKVSSDDYVRMIQQEINTLSNRVGTSLTFDQANSIGASQIALQKLVSTTILNQLAADLNISRGDDALRASISSNPAFFGLNGKFDQKTYKLVLENINLQPKEYEEILRKEISRSLIIDMITTEEKVPSSSVTLIYDYINEERVFDIVTITRDDLTKELTVSDSEVKKFYETAPNLFTQPLTKEISYAYLSLEDAIKKQKISDSAIRDEYLSREPYLNLPEKRVMQQIFFQNETDALEAIQGSQSKLAAFDLVVEKRKLSDDDIDLGTIGAADLPENARDEVFSSNKIGVFGPFETELGYVLYNVKEVVPAISKTLDEEYEVIKKDLGTYQAEVFLDELMNLANDQLAEGYSLEEITDNTDMKIGTLSIYEGSEAPIFANTKTFREAINSANDLASDVFLNDDGGVFSIRLDREIQPFVMKFLEVKEKAKELALKEKIEVELRKKAEELISLTDTGENELLQLSKLRNYTIIENQTTTRFDKIDALPSVPIEDLFKTENSWPMVFSEDDKAHLVELKSSSTKILTSEEEAKIKRNIEDQLSQSLNADISNTLINSFRQNYDLLISQKAIDATIARFK